MTNPLSSNTDVARAALSKQIPFMARGKPGLGERIAQARAAAGLSQTDLGKAFKLTRSAVSQWESNRTEPTPQNLRGVAMETNVRYEWLATGRGAMLDDIESDAVAAGMDRPPRRTLKVKGYIGAGDQAHYYAVGQGDLGEIEASDRDPPTAVAVEIMGTSLGRLFDRWYAVYDDVRSPMTDDLIGHLCAVGLADGRILIKKVERNGKKFNLISNSETEPTISGVDIDWAAKITIVRPK